MIIAGMKRRSYGCLFLLADKNTIILLISTNKKRTKGNGRKIKKSGLKKISATLRNGKETCLLSKIGACIRL
jgi:hypothetical protein|nr:MAG TPA: hypothetical protein [Caudoviricetes sp.]